MRFEFSTPSQIIFGPGTLKEAGEITARLGKHPLVVMGKGSADPSGLIKTLTESGLSFQEFVVEGEPTIGVIEQGTRVTRQDECDVIIGFGGGSSIDAAKAISVMATNPGSPIDYLEVIGLGKKVTLPGLPVIAIPTTAGTGSEVTRNAVLSSPEHRVKVSLRSPFLLPKHAIVDPELTYSLPPSITASTGLDALTQLIEPFVSIRANPLTDALCVEGMQKCARSIRRAYENGSDKGSREEMANASLFGGLALANSGLGAVHGFASVIGGMYPAPHGALCARLLAPVIAANYKALSNPSREVPQTTASILEKYGMVVRLLTGNPAADIQDGLAWLESLQKRFEIPGLSAYGIQPTELQNLVEKTLVASSTQANPIKLTPEELLAIVEQAL